MEDFGRSVLLDKTGEYIGFVDGDVPSVFKYAGRNYVLGRYLRQRLRRAVHMPAPEPKGVGELRALRRFVDLRESGMRGWRAREEKRVQDSKRALKKLEISNSRKGIGL